MLSALEITLPGALLMAWQPTTGQAPAASVLRQGISQSVLQVCILLQFRTLMVQTAAQGISLYMLNYPLDP